jgi:hypothetical protein
VLSLFCLELCGGVDVSRLSWAATTWSVWALFWMAATRLGLSGLCAQLRALTVLVVAVSRARASADERVTTRCLLAAWAVKKPEWVPLKNQVQSSADALCACRAFTRLVTSSGPELPGSVVIVECLEALVKQRGLVRVLCVLPFFSPRQNLATRTCARFR